MNQNLQYSIPSVLICLPLFLLLRMSAGTTITLLNKCDYTLWPGILPNAGSSGFELPSGTSRSFQPPPGWSGRVWTRTRCTFYPHSGQGSCMIGDCGSGQLECNGSGAAPPATLAEFTLGFGSGNPDYYDVSLVDGFNVPMVIEPHGGYGSCRTTGCAADLNQQCPTELRVGEGGACRSACASFGTPAYCCSGAYASPATCRPSVYSQMFKLACPTAYSYAYDDATSTFTCSGADYTITFCPSLSSQRKSSSDSQSSSTGPQTTVSGFGYGVLGSGSGSNTDSTSSSSSGSGSDSSSSSRHGHKFFIGGGQMLPNSSPPSSIVNDSCFAWQSITLIMALISLQLLCL